MWSIFFNLRLAGVNFVGGKHGIIQYVHFRGQTNSGVGGGSGAEGGRPRLTEHPLIPLAELRFVSKISMTNYCLITFKRTSLASEFMKKKSSPRF